LHIYNTYLQYNNSTAQSCAATQLAKQTMQNANTNIVYKFLLQNSNSKQRTAANIAQHTQLTTQQVCSALQNLQKRKLVAASKQQHKRNTYSIIAQQAAAVQQHSTAAVQQRTIMQRIAQAFNALLNK
jgi:DNA-binding transcriptional regulator GbsR (MarR family)